MIAFISFNILPNILSAAEACSCVDEFRRRRQAACLPHFDGLAFVIYSARSSFIIVLERIYSSTSPLVHHFYIIIIITKP